MFYFSWFLFGFNFFSLKVIKIILELFRSFFLSFFLASLPLQKINNNNNNNKSEPPESRKPTQKWRLYVFKGKEQIDLLHIHRQSAFLIGRERKVKHLFLFPFFSSFNYLPEM